MADRINFAFSERHCKRSFDNHRKNAVRIQLHCIKRRAVGNHGTPFVCQICAMGKIYFEEYQNIRKRGKGGRTAIVVRRDICGKEHAMEKFRRDAGCRTCVRTAMRSNERLSDVKGGKYPIARRAKKFVPTAIGKNAFGRVQKPVSLPPRRTIVQAAAAQAERGKPGTGGQTIGKMQAATTPPEENAKPRTGSQRVF